MRGRITKEPVMTQVSVSIVIFLVVLIGGLAATSKAPDEIRWIPQLIAFLAAVAAAFGVAFIVSRKRVIVRRGRFIF